MLELATLGIGIIFCAYLSYILLKHLIRLPNRLARVCRRLFRKRTTILSFRSLDALSRDDMQEWLVKEGFLKEMIWESEATKN